MSNIGLAVIGDKFTVEEKLTVLCRLWELLLALLDGGISKAKSLSYLTDLVESLILVLTKQKPEDLTPVSALSYFYSFSFILGTFDLDFCDSCTKGFKMASESTSICR